MAKKAAKKPTKKIVKKPTKRGSFISKAPVRRLMRGEGATLVSEEALELLIKKIEEHGTYVTKKAVSLVKDEKRKRLTADDVNWAIN